MLTTLFGYLEDGLREMIREVRDPYRPELHYMRGPGPKWREAHADEQDAKDRTLASQDGQPRGIIEETGQP
jgi:hypothetical protein